MAERRRLWQRMRWLNSSSREAGSLGRCKDVAVMLCLAAWFCAIIAQPTRQALAAPQQPTTDEASTDEGSDDEASTDQASDDEQQKEAEEVVGLTPEMLAFGLLSGPIVWGDKPLNVDWSQMRKLPVRVYDENNQPLKNAKVTLGTLSDEAGTRASIAMISGMQTNDQGVAQLLIPTGTARVGLHLSAPGYATEREDFNTTGKIEVRLSVGRTITVRATDETGKLLPNAFPMVENSRFWGREFKQQPDGTHLSPDLPEKRKLMRVTDTTRSDGVVLFSEMVDIDREGLIGKNGFVNLKLRPGVRLEGRLDDSVPRPVKQGFVELYVSEGGDPNYLADGVEWQDQAEIKSDGTFVFQSLPPGTHAQLFLLGDGYQSLEPTREQLDAYAEKHGGLTPTMIDSGLHRNDPLPTLIYLGAPVVKATMACRETANLDVRVVDPAGNPLPGATATMSPNLYFFGELVIPGIEGNTRFMIDTHSGKKISASPLGILRSGPLLNNQFVRDAFLQVTADDKGIAHFRNIPSLSESFEITAKGYVMAAYPTSTREEPGRYGLARNLRAGETVTKTITMERDVPNLTRELTVVYHNGQPLKDVEITITDITTSTADNEWQQWSVQRFGQVSNETTDENGLVVLYYPQALDGKPIQSLRLYLKGHPEDGVYFYANLNVPAKADGNVIKFTPEDAPRTPGQLLVAVPSYVDLAADNDRNAAEQIRMLLAKPSVIGLRQLLVANNFDAAEPLTLKSDRDIVSRDEAKSIRRINTDDGWRIVALCNVRPKGETWVDKPRLRSPPEAAFVFDGKGKLLAMHGGQKSARGSYDDVMLTNLGTTGDYFLRASAFEDHPPFEKYSRWYRIGSGDKPALTTYNYANAMAWDGGNGKSDPISEFGYTEYEFNGQDIDVKLPGQNAAGAAVPRRIVWDGRRNKFFAEPTQSYNDRSLYQVVIDESADFVPVVAGNETVVVTGGRRDYENWHAWLVTVQEGQDLVARLIRRDAGGNTIDTIREDDLQPGLHNLQLQIATKEQATESTLTVMFNAANWKERIEYVIPAMEIDARPSVAGQAVYVAAKPPVRVFDRELAANRERLVWVIESR